MVRLVSEAEAEQLTNLDSRGGSVLELTASEPSDDQAEPIVYKLRYSGFTPTNRPDVIDPETKSRGATPVMRWHWIRLPACGVRWLGCIVLG